MFNLKLFLSTTTKVLHNKPYGVCMVGGLIKFQSYHYDYIDYVLEYT